MKVHTTPKTHNIKKLLLGIKLAENKETDKFLRTYPINLYEVKVTVWFHSVPEFMAVYIMEIQWHRSII